MDACDVAVVGGGPAGSACAWKLQQSGLDVIVVDKAAFPRDKVCAGWITPQVVADLSLDLAEYGRGRTLQAMTGFRVGTIGGRSEVTIEYGRTVSYGIRRCEFDHYLLQRSQARLRSGTPVTDIRRDGNRWILNDAITAAVLVGAGGHFCPVARRLNPSVDRSLPLVVAQETEVPIEASRAAAFAVGGGTPELFFCRDLKGYGWCVRKQGHVNVGLGRLDAHACPDATRAFVAYLEERRKIPPGLRWRWRGHAYLLEHSPSRRIVDDGVLLVGDAAGLAYSLSGEGIRPAIESGLLAASTIVEANGDYRRERLRRYEDRVRARIGSSSSARLPWMVPARAAQAMAIQLLRVPRFVRSVVLDGWFLRADNPALSPAAALWSDSHRPAVISVTQTKQLARGALRQGKKR